MNISEVLNKVADNKISEIPETEILKGYKIIVESAQDVIFIKDLESRYILVNQKTLEAFGNLPHEKVIGKNDYELLPPEQAKVNIENDQKVFKGGKPIKTTKKMTAGNKEFYFQVVKTPIKDDNGKIIGLIGVARDITEHKSMEEALKEAYAVTEAAKKEKLAVTDTLKKRVAELEKAYAELQESKDTLVRTEKLAHTGRIAASIAHEVRNPLTNVSMSVQQFKKVLKPQGPGIKHLDIITRNTERINYLITELLNCARPPKLNIRPYDIHKSLKDVLGSAKGKIRSQRIKVNKNFTTQPSKIMIDREQIERAFLNIVLNAIEAMPKKRGKLTIITESNEGFFVVKIRDNGKGIPEKDIIRIFDPFFSTKSAGVGLGLTVCYGVIVGHGGTVEVESKSKKGSIFTISFPIKREIERESLD